MSLAYTTLLSLVPLMVFSFAILKGLGARGDLRFILHEFFRPLGGAATQLTESVLQFVANMRGELLGSIGLAFLALHGRSPPFRRSKRASTSCGASSAREASDARFAEYLGVMILAPVLLAVAHRASGIG